MPGPVAHCINPPGRLNTIPFADDVTASLSICSTLFFLLDHGSKLSNVSVTAEPKPFAAPPIIFPTGPVREVTA